MLDTVTRKPLTVLNYGTAGPFVLLPLSQLEAVCEVLDRERIRYWVEENAISIDGAPEVVGINFGRAAEADPIQAVLDRID